MSEAEQEQEIRITECPIRKWGYGSFVAVVPKHYVQRIPLVPGDLVTIIVHKKKNPPIEIEIKEVATA